MTHKEQIRQSLSPQQSVGKAKELIEERLAYINGLLEQAERNAKRMGREFAQWDFLANLYAMHSIDLTAHLFLSPLEQLAFDVAADYADGAQVEQVGDIEVYTLHVYRDDMPEVETDQLHGAVKIPLTSTIALFDQCWKEGGIPNLLSDEVARRVGFAI